MKCKGWIPPHAPPNMQVNSKTLDSSPKDTGPRVTKDGESREVGTIALSPPHRRATYCLERSQLWHREGTQAGSGSPGRDGAGSRMGSRGESLRLPSADEHVRMRRDPQGTEGSLSGGTKGPCRQPAAGRDAQSHKALWVECSQALP